MYSRSKPRSKSVRQSVGGTTVLDEAQYVKAALDNGMSLQEARKAWIQYVNYVSRR